MTAPLVDAMRYSRILADELYRAVRAYHSSPKPSTSSSTSRAILVLLPPKSDLLAPANSHLPDIFKSFNAHYYNTVFKLLFLSSSAYTIYLMTTSYRPTQSAPLDTFRVQYLLMGAAVMALLFPFEYKPIEILWTFSIWLESVAILPQLFMLQRTGEADTITVNYIAALGAYRALYIPNWIWRYVTEGHLDKTAVLAGLVQTVLYSDFFWIYYTKVMKGKKFALPV